MMWVSNLYISNCISLWNMPCQLSYVDILALFHRIA